MQKTITLNRRKFLKSGTGVLMGTIVAGSGVIATLAPGRAWSLSMESLDSRTGEVLLQVARHIFPHQTLDDAVYALVVKDLDAAAKADPATRQSLVDGVAKLDSDAGGDWTKADATEQLTALIKQSKGPMFGKVQGTAVVSLYNNDMAFAHFGYEGSSFKKGGYLNRGFQDLDWVPTPPESASPPAA